MLVQQCKYQRDLSRTLGATAATHHGGVAYELCGIWSYQLRVINPAIDLLLYGGCCCYV
jgi:hypothetical protein